MLDALDDYHNKTMLMEWHVIEKKPYNGILKNSVNDDLIYNVPIYDMGSRKYAAFCSLLEAIQKKEKDPKGNGYYFRNHKIKDDFDMIFLFYVFRLCGSGINYVPKNDLNMFSDFIGTHGFGNFWIVNSILNGKYTSSEWLKDLSCINRPYTDNKGYLLPQFTFQNIKSGHLKHFILKYSLQFVEKLYIFMKLKKRQIYQVTDYGNEMLLSMGFKRQNFVLTAFAADVGEYYNEMVDNQGLTYAGTAATRCIKALFPKVKKVSEFEYVNDVLRFQADRFNLTPIDCEDSRNCDLVRYFKEYQSIHHVKKNNNTRMYNNSKLKKYLGKKKYYEFSQNL